MTFYKPPLGRHLIAPRRVHMLAAALLCIVLVPPVAARADSANTLTVVGTSDVSDSGLVANVILPQFHAAYPSYIFKYVGTATGTAITDAETGVNTPSVLIVHAASLENQFVAAGYSYEPFGRAIFTNDFVLAGPAGGSDPAGVAASAPNNVVQAFANIATAGYNGGGTPKVTFVSRGGTPGTTVQEHQIWALVGSMPSPPAGLNLCTVSAADGGGKTPVSAASGLGGQPCGGTGLPPSSSLPSWYVTTGLTQGPNVIAANACSGFASPKGTSCYVLSDRGTFDYLSSGLDPAGAIPGLAIVTRGPQAATAPGGANFLTNYFHAYVINPAKCTACGVNLTAAQNFVNLLTSPNFQSQLKYYLNATADPAGPPFVADASPVITATGIPRRIHVGKAVTVSGTITNAEPSYPPLAGKTVTVGQIEAGLPVSVAKGTTDATGAYKITFVPPSSGAYEVSTTTISQIENSTLSPVFGDLLSPAATNPFQVSLTGVPTSTSVRFKKVRSHQGKITVSGTLTPAPTASGARIELFALKTTSLRFKKVGTASVKKGKTKFTIKAKLQRGSRYVLQLEYVQKGQTPAFSKLSSIDVP